MVLKNCNYLCRAVTPVLPICAAIHEKQGVCYLVGGSVRDLVLQSLGNSLSNLELKDLDIEVHGLSIDELEALLAQFGLVHQVGKKFGVLRLAHYDVDWSLPRIDSCGRKPCVTVDPYLSITQACRRRDVTMNAMALDMRQVTAVCIYENAQKMGTSNDQSLQVELIDPFHGYDDIQHNRLCAVDEKRFIEDPLRFFRVMQFIGRFGMEPDEQLNALCKTMSLYDDTAQMPLAQERIHAEFSKLFLLSHEPSRGFLWLHSIDRMRDILPLIADYFDDKDVRKKLTYALDRIAQLPEYYHEPVEKLAALLAIFLYFLPESKGVLDHDDAVTNPATSSCLLSYFTREVILRRKARVLTGYVQSIIDVSTHHAVKKLAVRLGLLETIKWLTLCSYALSIITEERYREIKNLALQVGVWEGVEEPILQGKDILDFFTPGKEIGEFLKLAYEIQLEDGIKERQELKKRALAQWRVRKNTIS